PTLGTHRTLCPRQRRPLGECFREFHHRPLPRPLEAHLLVDGGHASSSHWPARTRQTNASLSVAVSSASLGATSAAHTNSIAASAYWPALRYRRATAIVSA